MSVINPDRPVRNRVNWAVQGWTFNNRPRDPGPYVVLDAYLMPGLPGECDQHDHLHHIRATSSPTGKTVHVEVDGVVYEPRGKS